MPDEPRITDHDPVLAAARADASQEGARFVFMTVGALWRMVRGRSAGSAPQGEQLAAALPSE